MGAGAQGRRGRDGNVRPDIARRAEAFRETMEPPYDRDDIATAYERGFIDCLKYIKNLLDL